MLLHIIARGRIGRSPEAELVERYMKRLTWPQKISELPDTGGKVPAAAPGSRTILLDETGEQISSLDLAKLLERWRDDGVRETRFCLGAADGFTPEERKQADKAIASGSKTSFCAAANAPPASASSSAGRARARLIAGPRGDRGGRR